MKTTTTRRRHFNKRCPEPVFYFGIKHTQKTSIYFQPTQLENYFEYSLKKKPKDLSCHLQRVQYTLVRGSNDDLFTALCDLFIILGKSGLPLRKRLLQFSKKKLHINQLNILLRSIKNNDYKNNLTYIPEQCFFKKENISSIELYNGTIIETKKPENILHTADSYIEHSQFKTALNYMRNHLELDQKNIELTIKLISLYKALRYTKEFYDAYDQFSSNVLTFKYWDDARQYFLDKQA